MKNLCLLAFIVLPFHCMSQSDTLKTQKLAEFTIRGQRQVQTIERLPEINNTFIWSGKKNEAINVQHLDANIAEKTPRQIFSKVPGVFVYDMDGTGNQTNISTRGLDPHRGWEFNMRRNGAITNSDLYGYPASHYSMPMEAVARIELVRGTGSLQYGSQFGGMLNYVSKQPDTTRRVTFESINSMGSFGLLNTYNSLSGSIGKFQYYAYYSKRVSKGYRDNSASDYDGQTIMLVYNANDRVKVTAEVSRSRYVYQIPGPLTDSMFYADPTHSTRRRNFFNPEIYVPSLKFEWSVSPNTNVLLSSSALLGDRNSVQFDKPANVPDVIDPITLKYAQRQVDIDNFNSFTTELRLSHRYILLTTPATLVGGVQVIGNDLHRRQLGKGTSGTDFDLTLSEPGWGRDLHFKTKNMAIFVENNFHLTPELSVNPGFRMEIGESVMSGKTTYYEDDQIPNTISHRFPLFGFSTQYVLSKGINLYGGWSQSYRPVIFKDIIPGTIYERVDKSLNDSYGYNAEIGFRGALKNFVWDVTAYQLRYNNRLGTQASTDGDGNFILYRTNIGDAETNGAELFLQYSAPLGRNVSITVFTSTAFARGRYRNARIRSGEDNINVSGNHIESVPGLISRNGLTLRAYIASITLLHSYTGKSYADPLNTVPASATGAVGVVPSYGIFDVNTTFNFSPGVKVRVNLSNVTDKHYFTKRPAFYPGPGVWSSDGRSVSVSVGLKI